MNEVRDAGAIDVIDQAAGLAPPMPLHAARRFRRAAIEGTQASHDVLLGEPVAGLDQADRLRVAVRCCEAALARELAVHYGALLGAPQRQEREAPALPAMLRWAELLTTEPRRGDRAALMQLRAAGLPDAAIVALAQLVAFLSYQVRVVAGLKALVAAGPASRSAGPAAQAAAAGGPAAAAGPAPVNPVSPASPVIRINGFTNETLQWRSWLHPVNVAEATPLQLAVLDESHAQARTSEYYLTLVHQPLMLRHRSAAYNAIMYAAGGAPRAQRELAAMAVSVTNGCVYCTSVHAQRYAQLARRHDTVEQVFTEAAGAGSTARERAVVGFARALTLRPGALDPADIAPLRAAGLGDEEIIDVLHAAAIFGWANRLMHNLGEPAP
jgi:uncharacterized peroxidase-related enzyme